MWGSPLSTQDVAETFAKYCSGEIACLPWSDTPLSAESSVITKQLVECNRMGYLTINSQPAVDGIPSSDPVHGWGPKNGYIYQKAYLEFFVSPDMLETLIHKMADYPMLTFYAVNKNVRIVSKN